MKKIKIHNKMYDLKNCEYLKFNAIDNKKVDFRIKEFNKQEEYLLGIEVCQFTKNRGNNRNNIDLSYIDTNKKKSIFLSSLCYELVSIIRFYSNDINIVSIEKIGNDEVLDLLKCFSNLIGSMRKEYFNNILNSKIELYQEYIIKPNTKKIIKVEEEKIILNDIFDLRFNIIDNGLIEIATKENKILSRVCICEIEKYAAINNIDLPFTDDEEATRKFLLFICDILVKGVTQFLNNEPLLIKKIGNDEELDLIDLLFTLVGCMNKETIDNII